jgi:hypothetical protein
MNRLLTTLVQLVAWGFLIPMLIWVARDLRTMWWRDLDNDREEGDAMEAARRPDRL